MIITTKRESRIKFITSPNQHPSPSLFRIYTLPVSPKPDSVSCRRATGWSLGFWACKHSLSDAEMDTGSTHGLGPLWKKHGGRWAELKNRPKRNGMKTDKPICVKDNWIRAYVNRLKNARRLWYQTRLTVFLKPPAMAQTELTLDSI